MEQESVKQKTKPMIGPVIIIVLLLIIGLGAVIKLDIAGIGTSVFTPLLKDVPIIQAILPERAEETMAEKDAHQYTSIEEVVERLKATEKLLSEKELEVEGLNEQNSIMQAEIERLKVFENDKIQFDADRKAFDEQIVFSDKAPNLSDYISFYESVNPDNAAELYREAIIMQAHDKEVDDYANTYGTMKPEEAARIMEAMTSNMDLIVLILNRINIEQRADILGEMDPEIAAKITKYMVPEL